MTERKNILLVGMPRSGTSMTTNIFANAGYFIAKDEASELRAGDEHNPSGYWEAELLIESNVEIFRQVGYQKHNTWRFDLISEKQAAQIGELTPTQQHRELVKSYQLQAPFIWKDPRLCYTLQYWWPLMNPETTRVLFLKRKPEDIYQSFLRLKWRNDTAAEKQETFNRIANHLEQAKKALQRFEIPYVEIEYADFRNNPEQVIAKFQVEFGINLTLADLGYNDKLNHSGWFGKVRITLNKSFEAIPDSITRRIKKLIPSALLNKLFPYRYD